MSFYFPNPPKASKLRLSMVTLSLLAVYSGTFLVGVTVVRDNSSNLLRKNEYILYKKTKPLPAQMAELRMRLVAFKNPFNPSQIVVRRFVGAQSEYIRRRDNQMLEEVRSGHWWAECDQQNSKGSSVDSLTKYGGLPYGLCQGEVIAVLWPLNRVSWYSNLEKH